jgi:2-keto-4-pentenoate hydratase
MPQGPSPETAAALLLKARGDGTRLPCLPAALRPVSIDAAYAIQRAVLHDLGPVGGWKAGPPKPDGAIHASPIPASCVLLAPAKVPSTLAPWPELEVELALRLNHDLPTGGDASEALAAIGSLHVAVEVVSSRFEDRLRLDPLQPLADSQGNAAIVLGPALDDWREPGWTVPSAALWLDGLPAGDKPGGPALPTVLRVLAWLAGHAEAQGHPLRAGQVVMTGARIGPVPLRPGQAVRAALGQQEMSLRIG